MVDGSSGEGRFYAATSFERPGGYAIHQERHPASRVAPSGCAGILEVHPAYLDTILRICFWRRGRAHHPAEPLTGESWPARHSDRLPRDPLRHGRGQVASPSGTSRRKLEERIAELEREGKVLEAYRLKQRTQYDLEMMREIGYCSGIENYSRHLDGRPPGSTPYTLLDYFPDDFLTFWTSRTSRCPRSEACTTATTAGRRLWSNSDSGCRVRWTTGR